MPTVPRYDTPQVSPTGGGLSVGVTEAAFGGEVGTALRNVGKGVDQFGDVLAKNALVMQDRQNEAEAKEAFFNATVESGDLETWYRGLQGKSAVQAYPEYTTRLKAIRDKYTDQMANPASRKLFEHDFTRRIGYSIVNAALYAGAQNKRYLVDANTATLDVIGRDVALNPENEGLFEQNKERAAKTLESQSEHLGWSPERYELQKQETFSNLWSARIEGVAKKDITAARGMYDRVQSQLTPEVKENVQSKILKQYGEIQSNIAIEKFAIGQKATADVDSLLMNGESGQGLKEETVSAALGPAAAEKWKFDREVARSAWRNTQDIVNLSEAEITQRLNDIQPQPGKGFAHENAVFEIVQKQVDTLRRLRASDPAAAVMTDPEVQKATQGLSNDPASMQNLANARIAAQERAGISVSPMTNAEVDRFSGPIKNALPGRERQAFEEVAKTLQKNYGTHWETAFGYMIKSMRLSSERAERASFIMNRLIKNEEPTIEDARMVDQQSQVGAAEKVSKDIDIWKKIDNAQKLITPPHMMLPVLGMEAWKVLQKNTKKEPLSKRILEGK